MKCQRCGYEWEPRKDGTPKQCPACKSYKWQEPRKEGYKAQQQRQEEGEN